MTFDTAPQHESQRVAARQAWERQEAERIAREEEERKQAELRKIEEKLEKERMAALLAQAGEAQIDISKLAAKHLDQAALQRALNEKLLRAREEDNKKRAEQARRVDYLVRALRETERPKVEAYLKVALDRTSAHIAEYNKRELDRETAKFQSREAMKASLARISPYAADFERQVMRKREEAHRILRVSPRHTAHTHTRARAPATSATHPHTCARAHAHTHTPTHLSALVKSIRSATRRMTPYVGAGGSTGLSAAKGA